MPFDGRRFGMILVVAAGLAPAAPAQAAKASAAQQAAADTCFGKARSDWQKLVSACTTMIATNIRPDLKAAAHFNRGAAQVKLGQGEKAIPDFDAALKDLDRAITLDPKAGGALNSRALVRLQKGDSAGALADFDRVISLDGRDVGALVNRGVLLAATGETARARADFEAALAADPGNGPARAQLDALSAVKEAK
jgi:tetratricopeptide (TPR) repeat protein